MKRIKNITISGKYPLQPRVRKDVVITSTIKKLNYKSEAVCKNLMGYIPHIL